MNKLRIAEKRAIALQKSIAELYGIPVDAVNVELGIFRSETAYKEATRLSYELHQVQGCQWRTTGSYLSGVCLTVHDVKSVKP